MAESNTSKRKVRGTAIISALVSILLLFVAFAMTGMFSWISAQFVEEPLRQSAFWFSILTSNLINLFSLMSAITYQFPSEREKNPQVKEREEALLAFNVTTDPVLLEKFVIEVNYERKKLTYISEIDERIKKFIKKYKPKLADKKIWLTGTPEQKQDNDYCVKRMELEELKSDKFIQENLLYMDIKYSEISAGMIVSQSMASSGKLSYIYRNSEKTGWWLGKTLPRYATTLMLSIAWATFVITTDISIGPSFWVSFATRLLGMLINVSTGVYLSVEYVRIFVLGDLDFRLSLARRYMIWAKDKKATPST